MVLDVGRSIYVTAPTGIDESGMVDTYAEGIAAPTKVGIYYIRIYSDVVETSTHREYSTAPIPDTSQPIDEYKAVMRNPKITHASTEVPSGNTKLPSFTCELIDRISQQDTWSMVSHDMFGRRYEYIPSRPRIQILNRRVRVFHGFEGMNKIDYQVVFDGYVASFEQKNPSTFLLKCNGTLSLLDKPIFRHIKGKTSIAVGGVHVILPGTLNLPVTNYDNFNDPQDATYPFPCYLYVTTEDGGHTVMYQYGKREVDTLPKFFFGAAGDDISGGSIFSTAHMGHPLIEVWDVGDEVWEAMSFEMNPIRFALWVMETSKGGEGGGYDQGVDGFGLAIPDGYIDEAGLEELMVEFKQHRFRFFRTYKEMSEEPVNGLEFIRDEICKPLGLTLTTTNTGRITFKKIAGGVEAGSISDDDMIKPPSESWDDKFVYGEVQFHTDPWDHYDQLDDYRHKWIHGYTGTAAIFPNSVDKRRLKLMSRSVPDDFYAHDLEPGTTTDSVGNAGLTYYHYYRDVFPNFSEPYPIVKVETHQRAGVYPPGNIVSLSSAFLHKLDDNSTGARGIENEQAKILERSLGKDSVKYKLWRNQKPTNQWMLDNSVDNTINSFDNDTVAIDQKVAYDEEVLGDRGDSPVINTSNDAYAINSNSYKGQFIQLYMSFQCKQLTRTYTDIYPRIAFVLQVGKIASSPVDFIDVTGAYFFEITWDPPGSTITKYFTPWFVLPRDDIAYDVCVKYWKHNFISTTNLPANATVHEATFVSVDYGSPLP
jgi:hypothetical protein